ncbi:MAG TPA: glycoside hydrolase family 15 protein [Ktedonobacteraceae bacterium]|nr:glycoside hydrolase family 15 protein [Ktedonobacteraceae bacterium]
MNTNTRTYQAINSYGVIGDCHSAVLVSPNGSVDWGCLPDFDSPAIFCRLLDAQRGGYFQIGPDDQSIAGTQRYLRGSNVLQTRFTNAVGEVVLTDFMPVETLSAWQFRELNNNTWTREDGSCHCLVRLIECTHGELPVTMILKVTPDYAAAPCEVSLIQDCRGAVISGGQQHVGLGIVGAYRLPSFSMSVRQEGEDMYPSIVVQATLKEGERLVFAVGMGRNARAARRLAEEELHQRNFDWELAHTLHCWRTWMNSCTYHGPYEEWVERSALVLKMLTYAPTGAIVAAPTTSLPSELGGVRNWDYRFTWLRDATFTLYALNVLGFTEEAHAFTHWLRRLSYSNGEELQIMYGIRGEHDLAERELPHLSGYCDSRPVRVGNCAVDQKQMDIFGEVLDCIHLFRRQGGFERYGERLEGSLWAMLRMLVEHVCAHWHETDRGIWEMRGDPRHYVYSKVMCWVALDRAVRAAEQLNLEADLPRWRQIRDQIRTDILTRGYNSQVGAFTQSYDSTALDASNLMLPLVGFIAPDDPRMRSTVDRTIEQLTDEHSFVYRYHAEDGLPGSEGTFTICTFWLVDNLAMQGRIAEARSLFERLLNNAGQLGLFAEEFDTETNMALGNYPQAYTHIALINSAYNLRKAEKRMAEHHTDPVIAAIRLHNSNA